MTIITSLEWWTIFICSIIPYTPLWMGAIKSPKDKSHNSLVWGLYTVLDGITLLTGAKERINADPMVFGFAIGSFVLMLIMFHQRRFVRLGIAEIIAITLTLIGITLWIGSGPHTAFLFSIFSEIVVGGYLIFKTFKNPAVDYNFWSYIGFLTVSSLSVITTAKWTIPEVGYAVSETVLNILILVPLFPLWLKNKFPNLYLKAREKRLSTKRYLGRQYFYIQVATSVLIILFNKK